MRRAPRRPDFVFRTSTAVTYDRGTHFRTPVASEQFPEETVCYFHDYHEASGWLRAADPAAFIKDLATKARNQQSYGGIVID